MSDRMEAETRRLLIDPKLEEQGWKKEEWMIHWELPLSPLDGSRIKFNGIKSTKKQRKYADYALRCKEGLITAVIEAKREGLNVFEGKNQAIEYAARSGAPIA